MIDTNFITSIRCHNQCICGYTSTGYNGDFVLTVPNELGTPSQAATLNARKGVLPRFFGNASIDVKKANKLTPTTLQAGGSVFGNYGIAKFRKNVAEQALGDQTEGGFRVTDNGEVSIDQGADQNLMLTN